MLKLSVLLGLFLTMQNKNIFAQSTNKNTEVVSSLPFCVSCETAVKFLKIGKADSAAFYFDQSYEFAKKNDSLKNQIRIVEFAARTFEAANLYKEASRFQELYIHAKDSFLLIENERILNEMNKKFESEKKAQDILLLKKEGLIQELEISDNENKIIVKRAWLIFGMVA